MRTYVLPYRVLFHDTMAYGSHHFLTNFKFQCLAREHVFFSLVVGGSEQGSELHEQSVIFTREAYSQNLAPVAVGERVAILLTVEDITSFSSRFCFRVVHEDGRPIAAGYQGLVALDKNTQALLPVPGWLEALGAELDEPLKAPGFAERLHAGRASALFSPDVLELARRTLADPTIPMDGAVLDLAPPAPPAPAELPRALLFPGQGSHDPVALRALVAAGRADGLELIDAVGVELLDASLIDLLADEDRRDISPQQKADLGQLGIYALGVLTARMMEEDGYAPSVGVGHSLGEITALAASGVFSLADGARVVCERVRALRALGPGVGGMLALLGPVENGRRLMAGLTGTEAWPAVLNHGEQLVVAGRFHALEQVEAAAAAAGIETRRLMSPFPFHCPLLQPAVRPFADAVRTIATHRPRWPVYSPTERRLIDPASLDVAESLARQLVTPLTWPTAVTWMVEHGLSELVECGGGTALRSFVRRLAPELTNLTVHTPLKDLPPAQAAVVAAEPIAVVAMGCVLPGASDPEALWRVVVDGTVGTSDAGQADPTLAEDFLSLPGPDPDKTYTLAGGFIHGFEPVRSAGLDGMDDLSPTQRYLAEALATCIAELRPDDVAPLVALGSTADGDVLYDEALLAHGLVGRLGTLDLADETRQRLQELLYEVLHQTPNGRDGHAPFDALADVSRRVVGADARVLLLDAACASSLYAIDLGVRALRSGDCTLALCGGVFAPGPANSCLFSQFNGLSRNGSRPFDADADGVLFGDGAAILALRTLSEARARGEEVLAVIREVGTSSDGRGPSVAVPRREGQVLAMKRAWERSGLSSHTASYVEAHATATPVGDAVEYSAIRAWFGPGRRHTLALGSLKGLTGHTGWAAGAASVIKACLAIRHDQIPRQTPYTGPNPGIDLEGVRICVPDAPLPWPELATPRRAGVNGFGFGGSNAHVIIEAPDDSLPSRHTLPSPQPRRLAVVGMRVETPADGRRFTHEELTLPPGRPMLPDVADDLDRSQRLALRLGAGALPAGWEALHTDTGVVLALEGKTERSMHINQRLYRDRLQRLLRLAGAPEEGLQALLAQIGTVRPSGPYTLPGLMPNVAAGRVSNVYDLMGPNLVIDAGEDSLFEALAHAGSLLADGTCSLVLAGGLAASTADELQVRGRPLAEYGLMLGLMDVDVATRRGIPVRAVIEIDRERAAPRSPEPVDLRGVAGGPALAEAVDAATAGVPTPWLGWGTGGVRLLASTSAGGWEGTDTADLPPMRRAVLEAVPLAEPMDDGWRASPGRCLVLTDGPLPDALLHATCLHPAGTDGAGTPIPLHDDTTVRASLADLNAADLDAILVVRTCGPMPGATDPLAELTFAVVRQLWTALEAGALRLGTLCTSGVAPNGALHPSSGTLVGLLKAVSRDLPQLICRAVVTDHDRLDEALAALQAELACPDAPLETCWRGGVRHGMRLGERLTLQGPGTPIASGPDPLVVLTGGARGVTATLAEALLRRGRCRLILIGRSDPELAPESARGLDGAAMAAWEAMYYREQLAADPSVGMPALRARLRQLQGSLEVADQLDALRALGGEVHYVRADLVDADDVARSLVPALKELGAPDLIVHGAGIQRSGAIVHQRLDDFRGVLQTKLGGLWSVLAACAAAHPDAQPHVHLLTSAFSVIGNDGQHGYGAANQALDRLAAWREADEPGRWSAIGWPGWAGVGMTRGSEFASLARARALRPLQVGEGQALFLERLAGAGGDPVHALLSEGELSWAGLALAPQEVARFPRLASAHPHAVDHRVGDLTTLAGTFGLELTLRGVLGAFPGWHLREMQDVSWERFVRLQPDGDPTPLRVLAGIAGSSPDLLTLDVRLVSDFVHGDGIVLLRDVTHIRLKIVLQREPADLGRRHPPAWKGPGRPIPDPYTDPSSGLGLRGVFANTHELALYDYGQRGIFRTPADIALDGMTMPALLLDATCRISVLRQDEDGSLPVHVPFRCRRLRVAGGATEASLLGRDVVLAASLPVPHGEQQRSAWTRAYDTDGRILAEALDLEGRYAGAADAPAQTPTGETSVTPISE